MAEQNGITTTATTRVVLKAAEMAVGGVRSDVDDAHSMVDDILVLLKLAREQCQWNLADVEQSREAQARLHVLLEAAQAKADMLHNDTDCMLATLRDVGKGLADLQPELS